MTNFNKCPKCKERLYSMGISIATSIKDKNIKQIRYQSTKYHYCLKDDIIYKIEMKEFNSIPLEIRDK